MENNTDEANGNHSICNCQANRSLVDCNEYMLTNQITCDVMFSVGQSNTEMISAHKFVIASRSSVMFAMMYGPLAETGTVLVTDIEPHIFKEFLKYLYTEQIQLTGDNVRELMYVANKYDVGLLASSCAEFLWSNINLNNVCSTMEIAHLFESKELFQSCLEIIIKNGRNIFHNSLLIQLCPDCLEKIISDDRLPVEEDVIFHVLLNWAEERCKKQNLLVTRETKRRIMGQLLYQVRFPLMNAKQFSTAEDSGVLTRQEKESVLKCFRKGGNNSCMFAWKARQITEYICMRFPNKFDNKDSLKLDTEKTCIKASGEVTLIGVVVAIPFDDRIRCSVNVDIKQVNGYHGSSTKQSISAKDTDADNYLKVNLRNPVLLKKGSDYNIHVTFQHLPHCVCIETGQQMTKKQSGYQIREDYTECHGVEFTFTDKHSALFDRLSDILSLQNILIGVIFKM